MGWETIKQSIKTEVVLKEEKGQSLISGITIVCKRFLNAMLLPSYSLPLLCLPRHVTLFFQNVCSLQTSPKFGEHIAGPMATSHKLVSRGSRMFN